MKERFLSGITVGFFISLPWLALMYAGQRIFGWIHVPFQLFKFLSWSLPGQVITLAIETLIKFVSFIGIGQTSTTGKLLEIALAYLLALVLLSLLSGLFAITFGNLNISWGVHGIIYGFILGLLTILLAYWNGLKGAKISPDILWLLATGILWGLDVAWGTNRYLSVITQPQDHNRKHIIGELAIGSAGLTAIFFGMGRWVNSGKESVETAQNPTTPELNQPQSTAVPTKAGFQSVPGTRQEITPIEDFYRVDINLLPPGDEDFLDSDDPFVQRLLQQGGETDLPADSYFLKVDGLVENPLTLSLADIKNFPAVDQYATLTCISNLVGGDLIGTTLFQGARLKDVLETAKLNPKAIDIKFTGVDGYTESLPVQAALDPETLLCYNMGNQPLTRAHGSPLRLYTPGRYGIKNPKWIIKIEAIDSDYKGFWQQRGWTEDGIIKTTSVIDAAQENSDGSVMAGGIAFSGERGIEGVELRVDDGGWVTAELDRPLSHLTWVLWRAELQLTPGEHTLTVRAIDATGEIQTEEKSGSQPEGATGYHSISITI
ncbi:MAG: molybdopterin-dependent oxidoreductase [Anaerolineales bacterium]